MSLRDGWSWKVAVFAGVAGLVAACGGKPITTTNNNNTNGGDCGNGLLDPGELCDATNLDGEDCVSQGFAGGTLGCLVDCSDFDTSGCV